MSRKEEDGVCVGILEVIAITSSFTGPVAHVSLLLL